MAAPDFQQARVRPAGACLQAVACRARSLSASQAWHPLQIVVTALPALPQRKAAARTGLPPAFVRAFCASAVLLSLVRSRLRALLHSAAATSQAWRRLQPGVMTSLAMSQPKATLMSPLLAPAMVQTPASHSKTPVMDRLARLRRKASSALPESPTAAALLSCRAMVCLPERPVVSSG